jgi:hypothetical protein
VLCPSRERRENERAGDVTFRGIGAVGVEEAVSKPRGGFEGKGDDVAGFGGAGLGVVRCPVGCAVLRECVD